ncbi:raffinose/stachyose/melibiose transport system permease protein [Kribbella rubisoli]|jgi:raffinose/stachyose/melibiose transport system permease protein|uniref:Raffinose/stachyose/melibiose transport system permease protein n=1 Tax=Kribbella rubisoli TaxID=3075929 RepID=A0A4Q7X077_9ACTN|nr:carbohydrate ABC transporter permease [Kribbella rubisoli]RZU16252.1 raffinose/stachyose/melibiose transport system permease protein [Kribbella rubisoli]
MLDLETPLSTSVRKAPAPPRPARSRPHRTNVPGAIGGFAWLLVVMVPVYFIVVTTFRGQAGFFAGNPFALPTAPTLANYAEVIQHDFVRYVLNSVIVTTGAVVVTLAVSLIAAYAVVRGRGRGIRFVFSVFLLGLAIPLHATIIPLYYLITRLRLYDSLLGLILPSVAFAIPVTVLILSNFLRDIPQELFESMRMDGASEWQTLIRLALPLVRPALVTVAIYDGLNAWNGFLFPLILTQSEERRVLPLSLWAFQGEFTVAIPGMLAAVVLSTLPMVVLYVLGRRYLVSGLTAGFGR